MKKKFVIQFVQNVYDRRSAEGGIDHKTYADIDDHGCRIPGTYDNLEEAEKGIEQLCNSKLYGYGNEFKIDTRYVQ